MVVLEHHTTVPKLGGNKGHLDQGGATGPFFATKFWHCCLVPQDLVSISVGSIGKDANR
jgi:hypothetical protein